MKFEFTGETKVFFGVTLKRIRATQAFGNVAKGEVGGWIEKVDNFYANARVSGNAWVYGNAQVYGDAWVSGNARVYGSIFLQFGHFTFECKASLKMVIACSLNVFPLGGFYTLYKRVKKVSKGKYVSLHDEKFEYADKKKAVVEKPDMTWENSCSSGLHASGPFYAGNEETLIAVKVALKDIITCQEGKVRCKALTVIGEVNTEA